MTGKLLYQLLHQPVEIIPGQLWLLKNHSKQELPLTVVVTDTKFIKETKVVRGMVLALPLNLGDANDVRLPKSRLLGNGRVVLRITNSPLLVADLELCIGEIDEVDLKKILSSLNKKPQYNELQIHIIAKEYLSRLEVYRDRAIKSYEKVLAAINDFIILNIMDKLLKTRKVTSYYRMAAADLNHTIDIDKIWNKVEKNQNDIIKISETPDYFIGFILLDGLPHLLVYSYKNIILNSIKLKNNKITIDAVDETLKLKKNERKITLFPADKLKKGLWKLFLTINNIEIDFDLEIK